MSHCQIAANHCVQDHLLRLKGIVDFGEGPVLVESVFGQLSECPLNDLPSHFGVTLIGWKITAEALGQVFRSAMLSEIVPLKFAQ